MEQEKKGIELILTGLMMTLATNFLGGLDTGIWLSAIVFCAEALAMALVAAGLGYQGGRNARWTMAKGVAVANLILCLVLAGLTVGSMSGTTVWMAVAASIALLGDNILVIVLVGLILMGLSEELKGTEQTAESKKASTICWWFAGLSLVCLLTRLTAVILVNQAIPALTYLVVAAGLPALAMGVAAVLFIHRHV